MTIDAKIVCLVVALLATAQMTETLITRRRRRTRRDEAMAKMPTKTVDELMTECKTLEPSFAMWFDAEIGGVRATWGRDARGNPTNERRYKFGIGVTPTDDALEHAKRAILVDALTAIGGTP